MTTEESVSLCPISVHVQVTNFEWQWMLHTGNEHAILPNVTAAKGLGKTAINA
jgi:hypothetical protein